jgi:hypothetical protein
VPTTGLKGAYQTSTNLNLKLHYIKSRKITNLYLSYINSHVSSPRPLLAGTCSSHKATHPRSNTMVTSQHMAGACNQCAYGHSPFTRFRVVHLAAAGPFSCSQAVGRCRCCSCGELRVASRPLLLMSTSPELAVCHRGRCRRQQYP